jgi:hypothetical protein
VDWIASGSRFQRPAFESLWNEIADRIAAMAERTADRPTWQPSRL